eukprot:7790480-Alexandrium_andersonii.AAC.1
MHSRAVSNTSWYFPASSCRQQKSAGNQTFRQLSGGGKRRASLGSRQKWLETASGGPPEAVSRHLRAGVRTLP